MKTSRGLTLIELLVVFAKAREKARQTTCASNEKQLGLAVLQYNQDYDEHMPLIYGGADANGNAITWCKLADAYLKSPIPGVYTCPSNPNKQYRSDGTPSDYVVNEGGEWSGSETFDAGPWHGGIGVYNPAAASSGPSSLSVIDQPAQCISIVEADQSSSGPWNINMAYDTPNWLFFGHTGVMNFLFCDGHVKALHLFQTADAGAGGTVATNYWRADGKTWGTGSSDATQIQHGTMALQTAVTKYGR